MPDDIPETIDDEDLPQGRWLTEEEDREMKENLGRKTSLVYTST